MSETIIILDDDAFVCEALREFFTRNNYNVVTYSSAEDFLSGRQDFGISCILLDVQMEGMNGLELHDRLIDMNCNIPVIFLTGYASVKSAVAAIQKGAHDFLEKPFSNTELLLKVVRALKEYASTEAAKKSLEVLTSREREVFDLMTLGKSNKVIAAELELSVRTIEFHRKNLQAKLGASSLGDVIEIAKKAI